MSEKNENTDRSTVVISNEPVLFNANAVETTNYVGASLAALGMAIQSSTVSPAILNEPYNTREDFDWFTSGQVDTDSFKGKHIAIWKKQIVSSGETPLEAERIAKAYYGKDCMPAVVYIPRDEEADTIF